MQTVDNNKLDNAIDKAMNDIVAEDKATSEAAAPVETKSEVTSEPESEPESTQTEATTQSESNDDEPDALSVSPEELAQIKANPALAKLYRGMNKSYTQKTMSLAQERQLLDALRNPESRKEAAKLIATAAGLNIAEEIAQVKSPTQTQTEQIVDSHLAELNKLFTPEVSAAFKPILEKIAIDSAKAVLEQEVTPIRNATAALTQQAFKEQTEAEVRAFKAAHNGEITPQIEAEMAKLFTKLPPSDEVEPGEYMEMLYRIVKADTKKTDAVKEVTTRMAKAAASQEPKNAVQPSRVSATDKPKSMDFNERFDSAFEEAKQGR